MFIDEIDVVFEGGHGGAGKVSFGKKVKSGPNGGDGGKGGDLYLEAQSDLTLLAQFSQSPHIAAADGQRGDLQKRSGKDADDLIVYVPVGTVVTDKRSGDTFELTKVHERILLCVGGKGGRGNTFFASPSHTTPKESQPGLRGQKRAVRLQLKLIADVGFIGLPNTGKSSLLNELTHARAKTANYAFTTLTPNLGVCEGKIIADIPGLIEGAHEGKGLGIRFLKHVEKVPVLVHCVSAESENVTADYKTVRNELGSYHEDLLKKAEIVLLTKTDLITPERQKALLLQLTKLNKNTFPISIYDWEGVAKLKSIITQQ